MTIEPIMPLVLVQDMGPTAKLAHDASVRPEAAQAMARVMAEELLREESKQVHKPEAGAQSDAIADENARDGAQQQFSGKRHKRQEEEEPPPAGHPFIGKLVDKKV